MLAVIGEEASLARVIMFHHALGLTPRVVAFAEHLQPPCSSTASWSSSLGSEVQAAQGCGPKGTA